MESKNKALLIFVILFGMTLIPLGDTAGKMLMGAGAHPIFVAWSRLLIGFAVILPLSGIKTTELKLLFNWRLLFRASLFIAAITCLIKAAQTESIANVFGAFFVGPLLSYFFAAIFLKEKITALRSTLLLIGFCGALMVIKPGFGMTPGLGFATLSGVFYGSLLVATRWLAGTYRPHLILLSTLLTGALVLLPFGASALPAVDMRMSVLMLVSALGSAFGNLIIIKVSQKLPASVVAPFVYTQLIAAAFFSVLVFDSWPDALSLIGLVVLFVSGLASFTVANQGRVALAADNK
ncbi:DMT family transporter [Pseudoduganella namucuonensis]|uniref:EamA-like transporter family protein n=1 Tax=Pseudoduganella namucuonensis TaxID=1035707 RepID=A0A1I7LCU6_9BURK|nr:DMT family transporter [Pseudoduganella namucuonensis]SFV07346.1 EamA-like transporter family protein [Pseudoduganella namucuonensis]